MNQEFLDSLSILRCKCGKIILKTIKEFKVVDKTDTEYGIKNYDIELKCYNCNRFLWIKFI